MNTEFAYHPYRDGITIIEGPLMREGIYVVEGQKNALLIDTSMGAYSLKDVVSKITSKPLLVLNTHGHPDHAGGNGEFDKVFLAKKDFSLYHLSCQVSYRFHDLCSIYQQDALKLKEVMIPYKNNVVPIGEGDVIDLGGRKLEVILTPGHTKGSLCLYDSFSSSLFTGDTVTQAGQWIYLPVSTSLKIYAQSLKRLIDRHLPLKALLPGHTPSPIEPDMLEKKYRLAIDILAGRVTGKTFKTFAGEGLEAEEDGAVIIYDPKRLI
jgi:hydroxyacylglutathione hydrolase